MNLNQPGQPTKWVDLRKWISDLWNSSSRITMLIIALASGLVLNCCCIIIPLWDTTGVP